MTATTARCASAGAGPHKTRMILDLALAAALWHECPMAEQVQAVTGESSQKRAADVQRGTARAAVLGVSDGLVTNVSLILGISAADASPDFVRLAGFASLAAGAFSMAVGEYVSMRAQVELLERLLVEEAEKLRRNPDAVRAELETSIVRAGVSRRTAHDAARQLCRD